MKQLYTIQPLVSYIKDTYVRVTIDRQKITYTSMAFEEKDGVGYWYFTNNKPDDKIYVWCSKETPREFEKKNSNKITKVELIDKDTIAVTKDVRNIWDKYFIKHFDPIKGLIKKQRKEK